MINIGTLLATLRLKDQLTPALAKAQQSLKTAGTKMSAVGRKMSMGVTLPMIAAGAAALAAGDTIEKAFRTIQVATGATGKALQGLTDSFTEVFTSVPQDAQVVAQALADINTISGLTGPALEGLTKSVLDASRVLGENAGPNAIGFARALEQFQRPAEEGTEILDRFFRISQITGSGLGDLIRTTNEYGGVLKNAGFSMEESAMLFGRLESSGISVSRVMPGLNAAFRKSAEAGEDSRAMLEQVVVQMKQAKTDTEALAIATDIFGAEGAQRMTVAVRNGSFALDDLTAALVGAEGGIQAASDESKTLGEVMDTLKNKATSALAPFGNELKAALLTFIPFVENLSTHIKVAAEWFGSLSPGVKQAIIVVAGLTVALGPVLVALGFLATGLAAVSLPVVAVVAGIVLFVAALFKWRKEIVDFIQGGIDKLAGALDWLKVRLGKMTEEEAAAAKAQRELKDAMVQTLPAAKDMREALGEAGVTGTVKELHAAMANLGGVVGGLNEDEMKTIALRAIELRDEGVELTPELRRVADHFIRMRDAAEKLEEGEGALVTRTGELSEATKALNARISEQVRAWRQGGIPAGLEAMRAFKRLGGQLTQLTDSEVAGLNNSLSEFIDKATRTGRAVPHEIFDLWVKTFDRLNPRMKTAAEIQQHLYDTADRGGTNLEATSQILVHMSSTLPEATSGMHDLSEEAMRGQSAFGKWGDSVKGGFKDLWKGMTGGTGKISGMFSKLGSGIMDGFGSILSGGLSSLINMGVGLAMKGLGKLGSWIKGMFGKSAAQKEAEGLIKTFEDTVIASLNQVQLGEAGGRRWAQVVIGVRDAYLLAGRSSDEASAAVGRLWDAQKRGPAAVQVVMDSIQKVLDLATEIENMTDAATQGLISLSEEAQRTGSLAPKSLKPLLDTLVEVGLLTEENSLLMMAMAQEATYNWKEIQAAADRYGISVDDLGKKFMSAKWGEAAQSAADDWTLLIDQGAKANAVARKMAPTIQGMIDKYRTAGMKIPASLIPIIEKQIKMGLLTDEEGRKLKGMGDLNFAAPLVTQFDKLITSIEKLIQRLTDLNSKKLKDKSFKVRMLPIWAAQQGQGSNQQQGLYSGRHGTGGRYVDFGAGTPAVLHGRERVMTAAEGRSEVTSMAVVEKRLGSIERLLKDQPRAFGLAMSDTMNLMN